MSVYIISDLHLSEQQATLTALLTHFLQHIAKDADAVYILGDFFDVWIGDDDHNAFNQHIAALLTQFSHHKIPLYFMVGNRDFMLGNTYLDKAGCTLLSDPTVIELYGEKILLMHGDSLCTDDKWHILFRYLSRNRLTRSIYLSLPLSWRRGIANLLRTISRRKNRHAKRMILDANPKTVKQQMQQHKVRHFIHGHTHQPSIHWFHDGMAWHQHIVLSDWGKYGNYLVCHADGTKELRYFEL